VEKSMSRVLIETIVRKTLRDIKESPERSMRNLVDMALQFSKGRFQKRLFETVQVMLTNENSAYYGLVRDTVAHVDSERLLHFGMNLGYNSCTIGAGMIREKEAEYGYNIPWIVSFEIDEFSFQKHSNRYRTVVEEGEKLGIFSWVFWIKKELEKVLDLAEEFPDSVFFLLYDAEELTLEQIDRISANDNVMIMLSYSESITEVCNILRDEGLLYGIYYRYSDSDIEWITDGDLFYSTQQLHAAVTLLVAGDECSEELQKQVHRLVLMGRKSQEYQTLTWELYGDNCFVDEIISDDSCYVYFDKEGNLCNVYTKADLSDNNLFYHSLSEILMRVFPKNKKV